MWLALGMRWLGMPSGKRGRSHPVLPEHASACSASPCSKRWAWCKACCSWPKLDWQVLDCSTVCRRQKTLQVELSSLRTKSPLQLLVDITGIKFLG